MVAQVLSTPQATRERACAWKCPHCVCVHVCVWGGACVWVPVFVCVYAHVCG